MKLLLEDYQDLFDGIEVRRIGRVFIDLNVALLKPCSNNRCSTPWSIILLEYSVTDGINVLHNRKGIADKVLQQLTDFTTKGTEIPTISPPKQPQASRKPLCPFFGATCALNFPLSRRYFKYPDLVCII